MSSDGLTMKSHTGRVVMPNSLFRIITLVVVLIVLIVIFGDIADTDVEILLLVMAALGLEKFIIDVIDDMN